MRIALLCNDRLGLPALQMLVQNRMVVAAATSDRSPEMIGIMKLVSQQGGVPTTVFSRKNFEADLLEWLRKVQPDVVLVKTFPFKIPASALQIPQYGFINFHYAPLPEYRGSNPLFWMIKKGITAGGVTIHRMNEQFDTGPILLQQPVQFPANSTFGICSTLLAQTGAQLVIPLINGLKGNTISEKLQDEKGAEWYGRPQANDLFINWQAMDSVEIRNLANACNPWLKGAPTRWRGIPINLVHLTDSEMVVADAVSPGSVLHISSAEGLHIACKDGKAVKAEVIYVEEGFFGGSHLQFFGLKQGEHLG